MKSSTPASVLCAVLALFSFVAGQTPVDSRLKTGFDSIAERDLRADLTFLTSDRLEGRLSLRPGSETAIDFIVAEYAKAGLRPLVGDSYLQPVDLVEYRMDARASGLTLRRGGKTRKFEFGKDLFGGFQTEVTLDAPVVFAGFGITAPELGYDDYAKIDAKGKIVLIFDHEPQETDPKSIFNGVGNTRHANSRLKTLNAQNHGAVGVLLVPEPNRKHITNIERQARIPRTTKTTVAPQALADTEVKIPLMTVTDAVAAALLEGAGKNPVDLQAAIDGTLQPQSTALGDAAVQLRIAHAEHHRGTSWNVVGMIEGSDPALKAETIIFSGHFDHEGRREEQTFHGADDNGSGTVGVIELARAFAMNPAKPKRSLVFIVFAAEERGLLGSYYYAANPLRPLASTRAVINFDMIGRDEKPSAQTDGLLDIASDTSNELNLIGTVYSPDYRAVVERENKSVGLGLNYKFDRDSVLNVYQRSDQFPFVLHDIPAMWWFTGFHPDYHQTSDTVEKINFRKMEKILKLAYLSGWAFADGGDVPKFVPRPQI